MFTYSCNSSKREQKKSSHSIIVTSVAQRWIWYYYQKPSVFKVDFPFSKFNLRQWTLIIFDLHVWFFSIQSNLSSVVENPIFCWLCYNFRINCITSVILYIGIIILSGSIFWRTGQNYLRKKHYYYNYFGSYRKTGLHFVFLPQSLDSSTCVNLWFSA